MYAWRVESEQPVDLTDIKGAPAATDAPSYLLAFTSLPDRETETLGPPAWVIVHFTYEHHGTVCGGGRPPGRIPRPGRMHPRRRMSCAWAQTTMGGQVELKLGQVLEVTLEGNPTHRIRVDLLAGWFRGGATNRVTTNTPHPVMLWVLAGSFVFKFVAAAAGEGVVELGYQRPWESVSTD